MAAKLKFNPRFLMEQAVEIMRESVHEPRDDGRATPSVGAVIYLADGTVDTACRGELRFGDHAEFTLLERKHRADLLAGARLFTTLEPCAEGARQHPKLSCAERVHLARISEVRPSRASFPPEIPPSRRDSAARPAPERESRQKSRRVGEILRAAAPTSRRRPTRWTEGEVHPQVRLPARQAGEGDADRAGAGGSAVRRVGAWMTQRRTPL